MVPMRRVMASMSASVCSATAWALTPGVLVTATPRVRQAARSTLSVPVPQIEMRRRRGQPARTRSVNFAWARMLMTTSASPMRRISSASWSAPRSVCTVTAPSPRSLGSAEEPVKAAGKSSGTTILRLIGASSLG